MLAHSRVAGGSSARYRIVVFEGAGPQVLAEENRALVSVWAALVSVVAIYFLTSNFWKAALIGAFVGGSAMLGFGPRWVLGGSFAMLKQRSGTGQLKLENDAVVALTKILPSTPGKATITDGVPFSGGTYRLDTKDAAARIRVVAYASSAQPNEAVIAVFLGGGKLPLAIASKPTAGNRREKIKLSLDIPKVADQLELEFRVGPGQPGTIVFNGPENAAKRVVTTVTVTE
jgi:hypothetical protein